MNEDGKFLHGTEKYYVLKSKNWIIEWGFIMVDVEFPIQRPHSPNLHLKGSLHPLHYSHQSPCSSSSPQLFHFFHQGAKQESIINVDELVEQLNNTEVLHEQADIIHYLYLHK